MNIIIGDSQADSNAAVGL